MIRRMIIAVLVAAGGTGVYVFGSGATASKSSPNETAPAAAIEDSDGEWHVEYVDGEGNPIQRDAGLRGQAGRIKLTSNSLLKRFSGSTTNSKQGSDSNSCENTAGKKKIGG